MRLNDETGDFTSPNAPPMTWKAENGGRARRIEVKMIVVLFPPCAAGRASPD